MNQLNSIILEGNIVANAEISEPSKGFKICKFALGVNRFTKGQNGESNEEVSFFDVETYGKMAEICEKQGTKGRGIRVVGRLKQNRWKNSEGKPFSKVFVIAEHVEFKPKFVSSESKSESDTDNNKSEDKKRVENSTEETKETVQEKSNEQKSENTPEDEVAVF